jgi:hypothetical protein
LVLSIFQTNQADFERTSTHVRSRYPQPAEKRKMMKKSMALAGAAMISIALLSGGAGAQGTPQTVELVKVDVQKLAAGYQRCRRNYRQD